MEELPKTFVCPTALEDDLSNNEYKYSILLDLRDHEHTILWQKFNVFLGFNTIIIAIIAAVVTLQNNMNTSGEVISFTDFKPVVLLLFCIIFFIGFVCSIYISRILKGSDFWIDFWERKLYGNESKISTDSSVSLTIFSDHPSRTRRELDIIIKKLKTNPPVEEVEQLTITKRELQQILRDAISRGYVSSRHNMILLVRVIMWIWGVFFSVASAVVVSSFIGIFNKCFDIIIFSAFFLSIGV